MKSKLALTALVALTGCGAMQQPPAKIALDAEQFACVLASEISDADVIAQVCRIADDLRPEIEKILAGKLAAKRTGVAHKDGI